MSIMFLFLISLRLHLPEIRGLEFEDCHVVFVFPSAPPYRTDFKRGFARWEEDKGYVWVQENLPSENFFVDKEGKSVIFIEDITDCRKIHGWMLNIFNIDTRDTTTYCIQTEVESSEIHGEDDKVIISEVIYEDDMPSPRRYNKKGDTIFFYLKQKDEFLKHREFKIYKNGEYFKSIGKKILYFDIRNKKFGGLDRIGEKFRWSHDFDVSINIKDTVSFFEKLFIFDRVRRAFKGEKISISLNKFNSNSIIEHPYSWEKSSIHYYIEFKRTEKLKEGVIEISYSVSLYNDSIYYPYKDYVEFIKSNSNDFINLIKKFEKFGRIDSLIKPLFQLDMRENHITMAFYATFIKDKFYTNIELRDTFEYDNFYGKIKSKVDKSYRLLDLCMKSKKFKEEVVKRTRTHHFPYYRIHLCLKDGKFPPHLENGEPMIGILSIRMPSFSEMKKLRSLSEKERKGYFEKKGRRRKYVVYHLDERGRLKRWERN